MAPNDISRGIWLETRRRATVHAGWRGAFPSHPAPSRHTVLHAVLLFADLYTHIRHMTYSSGQEKGGNISRPVTIITLATYRTLHEYDLDHFY